MTIVMQATLEKLVQFSGEELESLDKRLGRMGSAALLKEDLDLLRDLLKVGESGVTTVYICCLEYKGASK